MLKEDLRNIAVKDLLEEGKISVRTSNCCFNAQFESLFDIVKYYESGQQFIDIRNAGKKTCFELEKLCKEYIPQFESSVNTDGLSEDGQNSQKHTEIEDLIKTDLISAINNNLINGKDILYYLGITKKKFFEQKFLFLLRNYSIRTRNRLKTIGFDSFVANYLFVSNNVLLKINGLGRKSLEEAIDLKKKLKEDLLYIIDLSEEEGSRLKFPPPKGDVILTGFVYEFYKVNNHLPMFWILEQQLTTSKKRSINILIDSFPIFKNHYFQTLEQIATKNKVTRERVRQIRNYIFHHTFEITDEVIEYKKNSDLIKYAELLQNKDDWTYILELIHETHVVSQGPNDIENLLIKEQCSFSVEFALQIIAYIFRDKFTLYGGFDINNKYKSWKSTYLIRKEFEKIFDFEKVKEEFNNKLVDSNTDYWLDLDNYISNSQSWKHFDFDKTDEITCVVKDILLHEFGLYSEDINGNQFKIPANKERNPYDVVYEILKIKGEPMHLEEIFVEYKRIMPEHKYTQENNADRLRSYLQRHDDITFRKRSSIYLLKKWEHIRSGTIRDVIIEFLLSNDLPQTVNNISEYVLKHFPETNQKNIHSTMLSGKNFIQFKNNLFGLVSKEYPAEYEAIQLEGQRKSFEQRLTDLEKFIVENEHFPFFSSENKEEESLCRWWNRIVSGKQIINKIQQAEVKRIITNYADFETDKNKYEWNMNYNKFKLFILENRRVPLARGDEKILYGWLRRAKDDFLNYRLSENQRKKYIELTKLI